MAEISYKNFTPAYQANKESQTSVPRRGGDIFDLADAFLSINAMTHKKLQKLCFYAKAWYLALYDHNLISEKFEAWVHGAVQPELYQKYKAYGFDYIPMITDTYIIPDKFL